MRNDTMDDELFEQLFDVPPDYPSPRVSAGEIAMNFIRACVTDENLIKSFIDLGHRLTEYRNRIEKGPLWDRIDFEAGLFIGRSILEGETPNRPGNRPEQRDGIEGILRPG